MYGDCSVRDVTGFLLPSNRVTIDLVILLPVSLEFIWNLVKNGLNVYLQTRVVPRLVFIRTSYSFLLCSIDVLIA